MNFLAVPLPRPRPVKWALWLALATSLVGVLNLFLFMPSLLAYFQAQGLPAESLNSGILYGSALVSLGLTVLFCFFMARGNNVVRWIWMVFAAYGLLSGLGNVGMAFAISLVFGILALGLQLATLSSVVLLFLPVSSGWFKAVKQARSAA